MYRHNVRVKRQRQVILVVLVLVVSMATSLFIFVFFLIRHDTNKENPSTATSPVPAGTVGTPQQKLKVDEKWFSFELPSDWKPVTSNVRPYTYWQWRSTVKNADDKTLTVYVDGAPPNYPINQLLPLMKNESGFLLGNLSDNCNEFTADVKAALDAHQTRPSRWQGIDFICDVPNFVNQAIGTGSSDGVNKITMNGATSGKHDYFFVYVDHNIHPNSSIFTNALDSFRVK